MLTPVPISVLFTDSDNRGFYHGTGSRSRSICFRSRVRHGEDRRERSTFGRIARWQHAATYLLYFVMLMNVFITTFGISGGKHDTVITVPRTEIVAAPSTTSGGGGHATALTSSTMSTSTMRYDGGKYDVIISDHSSIGNTSYLRLHD